MVEVTQEDRDRAADIWRDYVAKLGECIVERAMRSGNMDDSSIIQAFATHRTESIAALEADNAAHVRNTLDGYKVADELAAERDALEARVRELEGVRDRAHSLMIAMVNAAGGEVKITFEAFHETQRFNWRVDENLANMSWTISTRKALHDPR